MIRSCILMSALITLVIPMTAQAIEHEFIDLPGEMHPTIRQIPVERLRERYLAGDDRAAEVVDSVLRQAEEYRQTGDAYWLDRVLPVTPLGMWTTACPFHPERCQDFSDVGWEWSLEQPFRLTCPLCVEEGREYPYYPNPDYPDDGTGCYPSDEVWRRTHGPEWGREHPDIPWDRWDGSPHGYSNAGYAYFFRGKWHHEANMRIAKTVLPTLGEAWQICSRVLPADDPRAADGEAYARSVRSALITLARAHLGDDYLAAVVGGEKSWREMLERCYAVDPREFDGYVPYTLEDGILGSEEHPADSTSADIYCDGSQFGDAYADGWLRAFALVRDSYSDAEVAAGLVRATECLLAAHEDDADRIAGAGGDLILKYGKLDYHVRPYSMLACHNLDGRLMLSQFRLGQLFGDQRIINTVLDNYWFFLRNSVYGDGLSWEGSPAYTNVTWNTVSTVMDASRGTDVVPQNHPWHSPRAGGLDMYRAQELANSLSKSVLSCLPNGHQIAWEDSHAATRPGLSHLSDCLRAGAEIPEDCREFFDVRGAAGSETVSLRDPKALPSAILHNNRKAVMRMPRAAGTDLMALDYTWPVGHWHFPPMTLLWYTRGQEVLTDLGYLGAMNGLTREWIKRCPSHNTCIVRDEEGSHGLSHLLRGDPTGLMVDGTWVQVAEVAEQIPENLAELGNEGVFGRTVAQIAAGDDASYLVDIFRVRGGVAHEWYLHADGEALAIGGAAMGALEPETTLADHWRLADDDATAWRRIRRLQTGVTDAQWSATWAPLRTWDSGEKRVRDTLSYRCTMLTGGPTEIVTGIAPGQRYTDNRDLNAQLPVLCVRRDAAAEVDEFVAIHETIDGEPIVREVTRLQAPAGIVAVRVDRGREIDYVISRSWAADGSEVAIPTPEGDMRFRGTFAVLTSAGDEVTRAFLAGEGAVSLGEFALTCAPGPTGRLVDFDDDADVLIVEPDRAWATDGSLDGRWGVIRHAHGSSTFTIKRVERADDGSVRIALKFTPHLVLNTVRATGHTDDGRVLVEPRPMHPWRTAASQPNFLGFAVYRTTEAGRQLLGEVAGVGGITSHDGWGKRLGPLLPTLTIEGRPERVQAGDTLHITRLQPGDDRVEVMPFAQLQAAR